jgi:outer membrane protein assembly factor BamB
MLVCAFVIVLLGISKQYGMTDDFDWPRWRGPNGDGISMETDWNPQALNGGPKILWQLNVGLGHSNVAIRGDRLFTMGRVRRESIIYCFDNDTGKEIWRHSVESFLEPMSTPTIDGKYVYALSGDGILLCLKTRNGKLQWEKDLVHDFNSKTPAYGFATSPVIHNTSILLNANTSGIALKKQNGDLIWTSESPIGRVGQYTTPVLYSYRGKIRALIFGQRKGSEGNCLYSVDVETGEVLWFYKRFDGDLPADPILFDNKIFISRGYYEGRSILLEMNSNEVNVLWENENMKNHFSSCVRVDGYLYGTHGQVGGMDPFRCIDLETGDVVWEKEMKMTSVTAANGKLLILEEDGTLHIVKATPSLYQEISNCDVLAGEEKRRQFWTPPVLCNGRIYIRNFHGDLICVDVSK